MITAERYHDISCGHRVYGHESKCAHLHGHNYRVHFIISGELDTVGRVLDFSVIKSRLCVWLEENWDHKFLIWVKDPFLKPLKALDSKGIYPTLFNPTAENMAEFIVKVLAPEQLKGTGATLIYCKIEETRKCAASYSITLKDIQL